MSKATGEVKGAKRSAEAVERAVARKRQRRAARLALGRCAYCGGLPEGAEAAGATRCGRCLELQRVRNRALAARRKAAREAARRAASPRQCPQCGGSDLVKDGTLSGRPHFRCKTCGRRSFGDGPPEAMPEYRCPYCKGQCKKLGTREMAEGRRVQRFRCKVCGRNNTNLWPEDGESPGGPFPHLMTFYLNKSAENGLEAYLQAKGMSAAQAIREIFIAAGTKPLGFVSRTTRTHLSGQWDDRNDWDDGYPEAKVVSVPIPAPPLVPIPSGGVALPDLRPEASRKTASQTGRAWHGPTVLVTWRFSVNLNDASLQGLLATIERRGLNHQEAARALCAEARV